MKKDIFDYNRFLKPMCELITKHKDRKLISWDASFSEGGYKYPNRHDFYYKCNKCGYVFFNHKPSKEDIAYIKQYDIDKKENKQ